MVVTALAGTVVLVGFVAIGYVDSNLRPAVSVNSISITRADLRGRLALNAALTQARLAHIRTAAAVGLVTAEQQATMTAAIEAAAGDPVSAAIDALVDDTLITTAADDAGLRRSVDDELELSRAAAFDLSRELLWLTIDDSGRPAHAAVGVPAPAPEGASRAGRATQRTNAAAWAFAQLQRGSTLASIKSALVDCGWKVAQFDAWIGDSGPVLDLPDGLLVAARDPAVRPLANLGPFVDPIHATGSIGIVKQVGDASDVAVNGIVASANVDSGAIHRWAAARAAERALSTRLLIEWRTTPQPQVRAAELVIGPSDVQGRKGKFVSFAHLVVDQLPADVAPPAGPDRAGRIAAELASLDRADRQRRFSQFVEAANRIGSDDPLRRSGELGYFTKDELVPELAAAAFAGGEDSGAVLGPVQTAAGPELYLVRGRFSGTLDDRSDAELVEARAGLSLAIIAARISPIGDVPRAADGLWRAEAELVGSQPAHHAMFDAPIEALSDPFILGNQIVMARPLERRIAELDRDTLNRLAVQGWTAWLTRTRASASVVVDPEPLPGIRAPTAPPEAGMPSPLETPFLPQIPDGGSPVLPTYQLKP